MTSSLPQLLRSRLPSSKYFMTISKIKKSDFIEIDAQKGTMNVKISNKLLDKRLVSYTSTDYSSGYGRELFKTNRSQVTSSDKGAISIG